MMCFQLTFWETLAASYPNVMCKNLTIRTEWRTLYVNKI